MSDAVERFLEAAAELGFTADVREMDNSTHTAADAAAAVGCSVGAIVKSLVFLADETPLLVLVSGQNRVDTVKLGETLEANITKADAKLVKEVTGYSIGGVPPFGHLTQLRTVVDADLLTHDEVWAAAGSSTAVFPVTPDDLVELTRGNVVFVS